MDDRIRPSDPSGARGVGVARRGIARVGLALAALASLVAPASADEVTRTVAVRWTTAPVSSPADSFLILVGEGSGSYSRAVTAGRPEIEPDLYETILQLRTRADQYVAVQAFNAAGASAPSNELRYPAVPLPTLSEGPVVALGQVLPRRKIPLVDLAGAPYETPGVEGAGQHVAWCQLDDDGIPDLVIGQDDSGTGRVAVILGGSGSVAAELGSPGSRAARPACGDLDGDGRDEIVVGLGPEADQAARIFDDATGSFLPFRGGRLDATGALARAPWPDGAPNVGATLPALGDLDGDGRDELVLSSSEAHGYLRVLDDLSQDLAPLDVGFVKQGFVTTFISGVAVWPALGDIDRDGRDELVLGFPGTHHGWLRVMDDPVEVPRISPGVGWFAVVAAQQGDRAVHPALGDLDGDGRDELVLGFGPDLQAIVQVMDVSTGIPLPHPDLPSGGVLDVSVQDLVGPVFPAIREAPSDPVLPPPIVFGGPSAGHAIKVARVDGSLTAWAAGGLASPLAVRSAWCDVTGEGNPELLVAFGPGGEGEARLGFWDGAAFVQTLSLFAGSGAYAAANGELVPACGDVDGDGRDEMVLGPGPGGAGKLYVLDDVTRLFGPFHGLPDGVLEWTTWKRYLDHGGGARPALGDLDGDGRAELVIGLGDGGDGWIQIRDDAATGFAPMNVAPLISGWLHFTSDPVYRALGGGSRIAMGDLDGDGRDEIAVGFDAGGGGRVVLLDDALAGFAPLGGEPGGEGGIRIEGIGDGSTHPALVDVDRDGRAELVVGFGPGGSDWLYVADDALAGFVPHPSTPAGDGFVDLAPFTWLDGPVAPAAGDP